MISSGIKPKKFVCRIKCLFKMKIFNELLSSDVFGIPKQKNYTITVLICIYFCNSTN